MNFNDVPQQQISTLILNPANSSNDTYEKMNSSIAHKISKNDVNSSINILNNSPTSYQNRSPARNNLSRVNTSSNNIEAIKQKDFNTRLNYQSNVGNIKNQSTRTLVQDNKYNEAYYPFSFSETKAQAHQMKKHVSDNTNYKKYVNNDQNSMIVNHNMDRNVSNNIFNNNQNNYSMY